VTPRGFEPPTNRTGICHSIQLNYGAINTQLFGKVENANLLKKEEIFRGNPPPYPPPFPTLKSNKKYLREIFGLFLNQLKTGNTNRREYRKWIHHKE
jgi:hypothetical protein